MSTTPLSHDENAQPVGRVPAVFDLAFLTNVPDVTELILVRHGQQHFSEGPGRPIGETIDPPLSAVGRQQAALVGHRFSEERIDAVYCSNLQRAYDTGHQIAFHHSLQMTVVDDLREIEVFRDIPPERAVSEVLGASLLAGIRERMRYERCWDVYPLSESSFDFRKRCVNAIEGVIAECPGKRVAVACHGGVINAYVAHVIGVKEDMFFRPAHTAVNIVYAREGVRALRSLNDVHHLQSVDDVLVTF